MVIPELLTSSDKPFDWKHTIFLFEELENNLHPATFRRLLNFIITTAKREGCFIFLTSHSPVAIDAIAREVDAQIVRVIHSELANESTVEKCKLGPQGNSILDDLGARASDVLQANVVVWLEGPSDAIYLRKWIEVWSDGEIVPDLHYQCVFYGGSVRSHLSFDDPELAERIIQAFRVNRNAIFIGDSDKKTENSDLKPDLIRVASELRDKGLVWITAGKKSRTTFPSKST